jgi:tetratricopeptide (TPR) repeat protein
MVSSYYVLVFGLILVLGLALLGEENEERPAVQPRILVRPATWWAYPLILAVTALAVIYTNLRVIHADMAYKQAEPYDRQKQWEASIVLHQEAIKLAPLEDFYYLFLGRSFLEKAKTAPVSDRPAQTFTLSQALRLSPQQMADLSRDDYLSLSNTVLQRARQINPLNTDHSANLGRLYRTRAELDSDPAQKDAYFEQALQYYEEATSLSPHAAHLFDEWGLVYFVMGDRPEAIAKYEHSLTIDDRYLNTYLSLGDAYLAMNELSKAQDAYLEALELDPNVPEAHSVLAYLYGKDGRTQEAISETLQVLALSNNPSLLYNSYKNLALFYQEQGRLEDGMRAAQEALARAPEKERTSIQGLIAQLEAQGAAPQIDQGLQQYLVEGEAALKGQDWPVAEGAYKRALALDPNLVVAHSALAYIYAQQGRLQEAEAENQIVLAAVPGDYATLKNLAIIYRQLGRLDDSLDYAQSALESPYATEEEKTQLEMFIREIEGLQGG